MITIAILSLRLSPVKTGARPALPNHSREHAPPSGGGRTKQNSRCSGLGQKWSLSPGHEHQGRSPTEPRWHGERSVEEETENIRRVLTAICETSMPRTTLDTRRSRAEDGAGEPAAGDDATGKKSACATKHTACYGACYRRRSRSRRTMPGLTWPKQSSPTYGEGHTGR